VSKLDSVSSEDLKDLGATLSKNFKPFIQLLCILKIKVIGLAESAQAAFKRMADRLLLPDRTIRNMDIDKDGEIDGFQFSISNPFYTAEPVSSIRSIQLKVDGKKENTEKMSLVIRNQRIKTEDAPTVYETWWQFGEVSSVLVEKPGGLTPGKHRVEINVQMRTSSGNYGFGEPEFPTKAIMEVE